MRLKVAGALAILVTGFACNSVQEPGTDVSAVRSSPVGVGEIAPDFTLDDQNQQKVTLSSARGTPVILVFYRGHW